MIERFRRRSRELASVYRPVVEKDVADKEDKLQKGLLKSQLDKIAENRRALDWAGRLKAIGFTGAVAGSLALVAAAAVAPPLAPAAIGSWLIASGIITLPIGAGLFAIGKGKQMANENDRKNILAESTARIFRRRAQPAQA